MLIYKKDNKLNINFDNSIEAQPDVQLSKENGKVNIEAGGEPVGGLPEATPEDVGKVVSVTETGEYELIQPSSSSSLNIVHFSDDNGTPTCDKTYAEIDTMEGDIFAVYGECVNTLTKKYNSRSDFYYYSNNHFSFINQLGSSGSSYDYKLTNVSINDSEVVSISSKKTTFTVTDL